MKWGRVGGCGRQGWACPTPCPPTQPHPPRPNSSFTLHDAAYYASSGLAAAAAGASDRTRAARWPLAALGAASLAAERATAEWVLPGWTLNTLTWLRPVAAALAGVIVVRCAWTWTDPRVAESRWAGAGRVRGGGAGIGMEA